MNYKIYTKHERILADTTTPVAIYLRLRDIFPNSILLESSEYQSRDNNISYICCQPVAGIVLDQELEIHYPLETTPVRKAIGTFDLKEEVQAFRNSFRVGTPLDPALKVLPNGLFGYFNFDCIPFFEDLTLTSPQLEERSIPKMQYHLYQYVIAVDHFHNELHIFEHLFEEEEASKIDVVRNLIQNKNFPEYHFSLVGEEASNMKNEEFIELVEKMKTHIYRGDVFQIVPSRAFSRKFSGDEFNVYRALRSINPSPYLFYFDYGSFKLFGSSPEAQLTIRNQEATIFPIAGTFKRTGNLAEDQKKAIELQNDPKENAEHVMLVDLARNDLSRHCRQVHVKNYKETHYYSHVIHLVSKVSGTLSDLTKSFHVVADTYPAGTLSGAPKHRAIQLIDAYEKNSRSFYAGAIGYMGFEGDFNHAIIIRSFLSKQNTLHYQAGAGIVADSVPEMELKEVDNKIAALRKAMEIAVSINK
jgi:anthranilate synthase component 1